MIPVFFIWSLDVLGRFFAVIPPFILCWSCRVINFSASMVSQLYSQIPRLLCFPTKRAGKHRGFDLADPWEIVGTQPQDAKNLGKWGDQ